MGEHLAMVNSKYTSEPAVAHGVDGDEGQVLGHSHHVEDARAYPRPKKISNFKLHLHRVTHIDGKTLPLT